MAFGIRFSRWGTACALVCGAAGVQAQQPANPDPRPALAQASNCMSCHSVSRDFMGPSFKHIAARYTGVPGAHELVARRIAEGGAGNWGIVPMPANTQITPDQANALADWILSLN